MIDRKSLIYFFWGISLFIFSIGYLEIFNHHYYFLQDDNYHQFMPIIIQGCRDFFDLGIFPEITPYQLAGMQTSSVGIYALTYPITYISYAIARFILHNEFITADILIATHLAIGYVLAFIAARMCKVSPMWSCLFALGYSLSGYSLILARSWYYMSSIVAFAPLLIIIQEYYKKNHVELKYLILLGCVFGVLSHAGNIQMWFYFNMFYCIGSLLQLFIKEITYKTFIESFIPLFIGIIIATPLLFVTFDVMHGMKRYVSYNNIFIDVRYLFFPYYFFEEKVNSDSIFGTSRLNECFFNSCIINIFSVCYMLSLIRYVRLKHYGQLILVILSIALLSLGEAFFSACLVILLYFAQMKVPVLQSRWEKYIIPTLFFLSALYVLYLLISRSYSNYSFAVTIIIETSILLWLLLTDAGKDLLKNNKYFFLALLSFLFCLGKSGIIWSVIHFFPILNKFQHPFKMIIFVNLFLGLSGVVYISKIKKFKKLQVLLFSLGLSLIGLHLNFATKALCKYKTVSYTPVNSLFQEIKDIDKYRIYSFSPERLDHSSFAQSQINNFSSVYKMHSIDAYDDNLETKILEKQKLYKKIYNKKAMHFFYRHQLNKNNIKYLQELGVKYVINNDYQQVLTETEYFNHDSRQILKSQEWAQQNLKLVKEEGAIRIYEFAKPRPLAFVEKTGASLPITFNSTGALIDTHDLKSGSSIIVNLTNHKNYRAYADKNLIPHTSDLYDRIKVKLPEKADMVQIQYRSPWATGFLLMFIEILILFACYQGVKKWLFQTKN